MPIEQMPLDGKSVGVERTRVPLDRIVLDVENPRIQYYLDTRLNDAISQDEVRLALAESNGQYDRLKGHIKLNRGIYDPIWLVPDGDYYLVIEGNTRALIYSELAEEYYNEDEWKSIEAYILPKAIDKNQINFIRLEKHLFGPTPWAAYEKARELHRLHTEEDYSTRKLEQLSKLGAAEIVNNIQAFKDMKDDYFTKYWKPGELLKFSYFAEFRSNSKLKQLVREGRLTVPQFCDLVGQDRFGRGEDVRKLALVWSDEEARNVLLQENMEAALEQLAQRNPAAKSKLFEKIGEVCSGLQSMGFAELDEIKSGLQPAKADELLKLYGVLRRFLATIGALDLRAELQAMARDFQPTDTNEVKKLRGILESYLASLGAGD